MSETRSDARSTNGFQRQTLPQLVERAQTDIEANLRGAVARLPQSNLDALAHMSAGAADEQLEAIDYYATQIHVTTATGPGLRRHGSEWGVLQKEPTRATGTIGIVVTRGAIVARGALFQTRDRFQVRTTAGETALADGIMPLPAEAVETGNAGNLEADARLDTINPIVGVTEATVLAPGFAGGNPREETEPYRRRILDRIQEPPQGGADYDYRRWMLEYPGCTRAWVRPREQGAGTVVCRFAMDDTYPDGIPTAAEVERMTRWLDAHRPITAEVFVYAPIAREIDVIVRDLNPNTAAVRNAVEDELRDMLYRNGEPGAMLYRSWFWEAVSVASGERHHTLDEPVGDTQLQIGELGILGDLDFRFTPPTARQRDDDLLARELNRLSVLGGPSRPPRR
jgi:uncharacterized phage protein gp47/JayE